ncbi:MULTISPECIES: SH3 domain-containing protein [Rhizobium]|uniref:SH3 domain-containing protein n=1 Tax=Rhizobium TaxID=379 RepID=UPI001B326268|nr:MULTISPECIES: SH3 domain-containing protein [Rhizobium]MBX4910753.1 SH3 domain-containing protein [Rhizobium bangladeshense]MBX5218321.1 SH3 domain-containing protein [Rhizobium sp. NLR9a]MBX5224349.1 SH3 domain-containing protein [Rhizobium sp. NLR8a]MBX5236045.1 SH3 domain-containing protein [Rhizobium sp. NLR4a]MBX5241528.1 SH3 domain-containing protein [Rhizobium sp. NLR22b]
MKNLIVKIAGAALLLLAPAIAQAAEGYSTANVNMRAGPSTRYPAVAVIPAGSSVEIRGCLSNVNWCDVEFYGGRGWVSGQYVQAVYQQRRVYVGPEYYRPLGIPMVTFSVGNYWDRYYRHRDFYRERDRWSRGPDYYYRNRDGDYYRNRDGDYYRDRDRGYYSRDRDYRERNRDWRDDDRREEVRRPERRKTDTDFRDLPQFRGGKADTHNRPDPRASPFVCRPGDPACD